ncbi:cyclic nucleotide-binding domain-containing protein [Citrifermentans bremense]|uniref:cyclic nucleotide-binding domain-containing protein n=1 Tax=Citrifermentans bremense TaxID=60035 RepID=UPI000427BCC9|nr:cyclic nucleotide-binding domain-containing protein [Citrifermentans bremense]
MISPERLRAYRFFASLTNQQLTDIATIGEEKSFPTGSIIFKEHTTANNLMLLLEGGVELFYSGSGAGFTADAPVCSIVPGGIFGVSSLIKPYQYTSSARATKPVKVVDINGVMLREISERNQALGRVLMNNVAAAVLARLH